MTVHLRPAAAADVEDAALWYDGRQSGLGAQFLAEVSSSLIRISDNPRQFAILHRETRRCLLRRFPYGLYFRMSGEDIVVVACFHASRDPRRWQASE